MIKIAVSLANFHPHAFSRTDKISNNKTFIYAKLTIENNYVITHSSCNLQKITFCCNVIRSCINLKRSSIDC